MMNPTSRNVLWEGAPNDLPALATGGRVQTSGYKLTEDALHFADGVLSTRQETVPLWAVRDADLTQTLTQRARGLWNVTLKLDRSAEVYGQSEIVLRAIPDGPRVRDMVLHQANLVRQYWNKRRHEMELEQRHAGAATVHAAVPGAAVGSSNGLMEQLTRLGDMKQAGLLTDQEFAAAKAKLLGL